MALTFDDGPGVSTPDVLEALERHGARGTFFVVGSEVSRRPEVLGRIMDGGHEIGNHSLRHGVLRRRPARALREARATNELVRQACGFRPSLFRAPYGAEDRLLVAAARAAGLTSVRWDVDSRDWEAGLEEVVGEVLLSSRPGSIVLMHDGGPRRPTTVAALPEIIRALSGDGYSLVTVSELLGYERR